MLQKVWRLSHLALALIAGIFILLASITGLALATEPVIEHSKATSFHHLDELDLETALLNIKAEHPEVISIHRNAYNQISIETIDENFESQSFYINPFTGKKIANISERSAIYEFNTVLHRSLFLKSTGRFIIGLTAIFLILIVISGFALLLKRYGSFRKIFSKEKYDGTAAYWHSLASKYFLIPLFIIAISGAYLSVDRFLIESQPQDIWDFEQNENTAETEILELENINTFDNFKVSEILQIDFPFAASPDEYFYVKLVNAELLVSQVSGQAINRVSETPALKTKRWSFHLHTGDFSWLWSIILGLSSLVLVGLFISGILIWLKRIIKSKAKNKCPKDEAEIVILVGSETGSTFGYASRLAEAFIKLKKKVYVASLNQYSKFESAQHLLILSSTYGDGEAPYNASQFLQKLKNINQKAHYSVLGFGSTDYPKFCAFAEKVNQELHKKEGLQALTAYATVNKNNESEFINWTSELSRALDLNLEIQPPKEAQTTLKIKEISCLNCDQNFTLCLKTKKINNIQSGDLLAITPKADGRERLYSIAKVDNKVLLSVKKHDMGICSTYLSQLEKNKTFKAKIRKHPSFHLGNKKNVIFIANGTGIAPFLGMIDEAKTEKEMHVFFGLRKPESFELYKDYFNRNQSKIKSLNLAYSRQEQNSQYVQHLIAQHPETIIKCLQNDGCIMLCGSLAMEKEVKKEIDKILKAKLLTNINNYSLQIICDCY
ncbi:PepSY domain-containing protein [Psychroflexus halocasei]|uniref:NADPH--hemoprotein reductase n=1 Tax=Psychroflexus halocasei TaxID=908615 RepID=A0A1H4BS49_9FLAO|nr:PepSY domain-containing protein [Psychroflexus halocasei]SEA50965.1 sulfite reductase (NADPH) flavoprotein alpha-component [Psychroflexus halocasei]